MLEFAAHRQPENELYVHRTYERRGALCEGWFKASSKLHKKKPKADLTPFDAQAPGFAQYLEIVFRYVLQISDMPQEQLGQMVNQTIKHDVEDVIMTTYEKLRQEGELIGLQKGRMEGEKVGLQKGEILGLQKGASRVLLRLLAKRFPEGTDHLLPLLQELTPEQQDELSEKILDATSLEEIHAWLKSIRGN
ncbi:DUF4351 domain-containing protein [Desulfobulbus alkaliphilus]|uniref:DUF4351 domain-containing protein n=1 Tax=Desulfobulbus alkaliphilus TaxID=869814 RepID=UPI001964187B|nr:DUF4351 domain-containing protein [Desulfobulbus alkaliphilus]MBM9538603.1 DUF4351 domain-containing protein [Desulfobulbus alkaliphilus]